MAIHTQQRRRWPQRIAKGCGIVLVSLIGLFAVVRAVVEIATVNPARPESYRDDWGGPHYWGVLLVHTAPGVAALTLLTLWWRRRHRVSRSEMRALGQSTP